MITVGTTVVSGSPINGGGGGGAPSGTGVVTVTSGVFDTPSSTDDVVMSGLSGLVGGVAGQAVVGDGAGSVQQTSTDVSTLLGAADAAAARAAISSEIALAQLPVDGALHHWRLTEASSPFADIGSSPSPMDYIKGSREYNRAGVYARYGTTMQRSTASDDRCSSTIVIAPGSDITMGITVANEQALVSPPGGTARVIFSLDCGGTRNGFLILTDTNGNIYVNVSVAGGSVDITPGVTVSWARPFRVDVTRNGASGLTLVYIDGLLARTATITGTMGAITLAEIGGSARPLVDGSALMMNDATIHTSVLSAATLLSRADACRRLAAG